MGAMRVPVALSALLLFSFCVSSASADDQLAEARRLYNLGDYEAAVRSAEEAMKTASPESARLVLGRAYLERYRQSGDHGDLNQAREALRLLDVEALDSRERIELTIGVGQYLFLDDKYGIAAESFERALDESSVLGPAAHERVLDWWATALDRLALTRPREARESVYVRIVTRMEKELTADASSAPAAYWLAAGLRGAGDLERAWAAAGAGWITAILGRDRGAALRADLDRLVVQGIIPERALRLQPKDPKQAGAVMLSEWEALKAGWTR